MSGHTTGGSSYSHDVNRPAGSDSTLTDGTLSPQGSPMRLLNASVLTSLCLTIACVNAPPTSPRVEIGPDAPTTTESLSAVITTPSTDINKRDEVTYTYTWTQNGEPVADLTEATVPAERTTKGDIWEVTVTPMDDKVTGVPDTASVTIANTPPVLTVASLSAAGIREADTLSCVAGETSDIDGDEVTLKTQWVVNGTVVSEAETIDGNTFSKGDTVACQLTPFDGEADGASQLSETITILNTAPSAPGVTLSPSAPWAGEALSCGLATPSSDEDGDDLTYTATWTVDGADFNTTATTAFTGDTVPALSTASGEAWTCTIEAFDGEDRVSSTSMETSIRSPITALLGDARLDRAGYSVSNAGDVDGDGLDDVLVGSFRSDAAGSDAGKVALFLGKSLTGAERMNLAEADYTFLAEGAGDELGFAVTSAGDVDGDGLDDLVFGTHLHGTGGKAYVVLGKTLGAEPVISLADADYMFGAQAEGDEFGFAVAAAGDIDGDGKDDLLFGSRTYGAEDTGKTYLVMGSSLGTITDISDADYTFEGESSYDMAGISVAGAGDVDGDGKDDLLIGAWANDRSDKNAGAAYLFLGSSIGAQRAMSVADADYTFIGENRSDRAGQLVASAGDIDGDGRGDFYIGAPLNDEGGVDAGKTYLFLGKNLGDSTTMSVAAADYTFVGEAAGDYSGLSAADAGDVDGDGRSDILIGARGNDDAGEFSGKAYLITAASLSDARTVNLTNADYTVQGAKAHDRLGWSVSGVGDVDGDGRHDFIVGARGNDEGANEAGAAYLVFGGALEL